MRFPQQLITGGAGWILLLLAGANSWSGFRNLSLFSSAAALAVCGSLLVLHLVWDRRAARRFLPVATLVTAAILLVIGLVSERDRFQWESDPQEKLRSTWDRDRSRIEAGWNRFLERIGPPSYRLQNPELAFEEMEREGFRLLEEIRREIDLPLGRLGLTLDLDGEPLAWLGNSSPLPVELSPEAILPGNQILLRDRAAARIVAVHEGPWDGSLLLLEVTFKFPFESDPAIPFLNLLEVRPAIPVQVEFLPAASRSDSSDIFLSSSGGEVMMKVSPEEWGPGRVLARHRKIDGNLAALILVVFFAGALVAGIRKFKDDASQPGWSPFRRFLWISILIWLLRTALLILDWPEGWVSPSLVGPQGYASRTLGPLLRSPADLFLTGWVFLGQSYLFLVYRRTRIGRLARSDAGSSGNRITTAAGFVGSLTILSLVTWFFFKIPFHTDWDLFRLQLPPKDPGYLVLLISCSLIGLGALVLAGGIVLPRFPSTGKWIRKYPLRFLLGLALLLSVMTLVPLGLGYAETRHRFLEETLRRRILEQEDRRRETLHRTVERMAGSESLCKAITLGDHRNLAFEVWLESGLAASGYDSSTALFDSTGAPADRFTVNLPPSFPVTPPEPDAGDGILEIIFLGSVEKRVLYRRAPLRCGDRSPGSVVVHILDEPQNLPFVSSRRVLSPIGWSDPGEVLPDFLAGELAVLLNDRNGNRILSTAPGLPPPSIDAQDLFWTDSINRALWESVPTEHGRFRMLSFSAGDSLWSIGYPTPGVLGYSAAFVRFLILHFFLVSVVCLPAIAGPDLAPSRLRKVGLPLLLGSSFYRKLFAVFLLGSLIPLMMLSMFMSRLVTHLAGHGLQDRALTSLGAARRIIGEQISLEEYQQQDPQDEDLYWLSRIVQWPLTLYFLDELISTSNRELYDTSSLPTRLPGEVFQKLFLEAHPFTIVEMGTAQGRSRVIFAPLAEEGAPDLVLALLMDPGIEEPAGTTHKVTEAVLVSSVLLILIVGTLGFWIAARISRPILRLAEASRRIGSGDYLHPVAWKSADEVGVLVDAFNRMASSLQEQREDLRQRRDYIAAILQNATTGVISIDPDGRIATINPAASRVLGIPGIGEPGAVLIDRLNEHSRLLPIRKIIGSDPLREEMTEHEVSLQDLRGEFRRLRVVLIPLRTHDASAPLGRILLLEDVTETVRSSRLAAWAEMARRIAHEIKNPLTPILLSAEHIRRVRDDGDPQFPAVLEECLATIVEQVHELRRISGEFSDYSRIPELRKESTRLAEFLPALLAPYRKSSPPGVRWRLEIRDDLPPLLLDQRVFRRALINMVENALEAMPSGGTLTIRAEPGTGSPERVEISVEDQGTGIEPEKLERLFEPYFSTKETGTGLGLAISRQAVEEHGGRMEVESRVGVGTRMTIILPAGDVRQNSEKD